MEKKTKLRIVFVLVFFIFFYFNIQMLMEIYGLAKFQQCYLLKILNLKIMNI